MKKTVEEPDLVPGARGWHWTPRFGSAVQTAIVLFSLRSLTRSRQHRVIFAFYLAGVLGFALSCARSALSTTAHRPLNADFLIATFMMMTLAPHISYRQLDMATYPASPVGKVRRSYKKVAVAAGCDSGLVHLGIAVTVVQAVARNCGSPRSSCRRRMDFCRAKLDWLI
jgi:hypothetical protein